jgi:hypothetical protein
MDKRVLSAVIYKHLRSDFQKEFLAQEPDEGGNDAPADDFGGDDLDAGGDADFDTGAEGDFEGDFGEGDFEGEGDFGEGGDFGGGGFGGGGGGFGGGEGADPEGEGAPGPAEGESTNIFDSIKEEELYEEPSQEVKNFVRRKNRDLDKPKPLRNIDNNQTFTEI